MSNAFPVQPVAQPRNGYGITALVLAIVGLPFGLMPITSFVAVICGLLAILFALLGHARYRRHEATNNIMCIASAMLGILSVGLGILGAVQFFTAVEEFSNEMDKIETEFSSSGTAPFDAPEIAETYTPPAPEPEYVPSNADWEVELRVVSQQCYEMIGCDLTVEPRITYIADNEVPSATCDITYSIDGDTSGTIVETASSSGDQALVMPTMLTTASSEVTPTAMVQEVVCY